jgi:pimeloyl-ACP methyl ester carboxylesterase
LGQRLHQQLVHSRFVVIRGAVHVPMWEKSAEFNRIVLEFLTDQPNIPLRQLDSTRTDSEL